MQYEEISDNYHLYHNMNPKNSIFTMKVEYGIGTKEDHGTKKSFRKWVMIRLFWIRH